MPRIALLSTAHVHAQSYAACLGKHLVGVWDDDNERLTSFQSSASKTQDLEDLLTHVEGIVIASENARHLDLIQKAAAKGKHILCEKPLIIREEEAHQIREAANKVKIMTAFPCRYSPAYHRLKQRIENGEIGKIKAICATNRGQCPFGWFVEKDKSGGGAMIDHVVHVADLLRDLLNKEPTKVQAQTGNNMYGQAWEDTAMLTLEYPSGVFATIDSSWSRPKTYKTWGDLTMNVIGETGTIELDMFNQTIDLYTDRHTLAPYSSDLNQAMINDFLEVIGSGKEPRVTAEDGIQASLVSLAGYKSLGGGKLGS